MQWKLTNFLKMELLYEDTVQTPYSSSGEWSWRRRAAAQDWEVVHLHVLHSSSAQHWRVPSCSSGQYSECMINGFWIIVDGFEPTLLTLLLTTWHHQNLKKNQSLLKFFTTTCKQLITVENDENEVFGWLNLAVGVTFIFQKENFNFLHNLIIFFYLYCLHEWTEFSQFSL